MYDHVTLLLSFIYVIALTHLLSCTTSLILTRERVRFSPLLALWMLLALGILFNNWLAVWRMHAVEHWSVGDVALSFVMATVQYFTCSLVCIEIKGEGKVDMALWYERQRRPILGAFTALCAVALFYNYSHRGMPGTRDGTAWIPSAVVLGINVICLCAAIISRTRWLQWMAALVLLATEAAFISHA